jgi:hypothetical protein
MVKKPDFEDAEADSVSPEEADRKGKVNIVKNIMGDPEVQALIKEPLLRETIKNSLVMACIFVGFLKLYEVAKVVINFNWVGDLIMSLILITIGFTYMIPPLLKKKK